MCSVCTHISNHAACSSRANSSATVIDLCVSLRLYTSIYIYVHVLYAHVHLAARCCSSRANSSSTVTDLCVRVQLYICTHTDIHVLYVNAHCTAHCLQLPRQLLCHCHRPVHAYACIYAFAYVYICVYLYICKYIYPCSLCASASRGT